MTIDAVRIPPAVQWANARAARDFAAATALAERILERRPDDENIHRAQARLLEALGDSEGALRHWLKLSRDRNDDFEACFHVAREAIGRGEAPVAAVGNAAPNATEVFRRQLCEAIAEPAPALEGEFKHVALCGVAFCGSTLLDRVLGGLPGVKSTGESHWLTKVRAENEYRPVDMSAPIDDVRWVPCTVCGKDCDVLTPAFRRSLAADQRDWYRKIAARLDTRILVSADKNIPTLLDKDPLLDMSALVVFKSPEQAWHSKLTKLPADRPADYYEGECRAYMKIWTQNYRSRLDHFRPQGQVAWLNFDAFTRTPEPLLRAVCDRLDLPYSAEVLERTRPGHAIGGNGGSMRRLRDKDYGVVIEPLPDPAIEESHRAIIANDAEAQRTWSDLMALHDQLNLVTA